MDYIDKAICERIKEIMRDYTLGQKELAERTGVAQPTISAILNCKRQPMLLVEAVSSVFGINKEWLLTGMGFKSVKAQEIAGEDESRKLTNEDKAEILKELNLMYKKHQTLMMELDATMKTIMELNKKMLLAD